ncbi:MAG: hypothetical protein HZC02_02670 [Candidatus Levybacteria bacterium]|nr:hypothetical protein [Candidatus Levybacteria bacterium]
MLTSWRKLFQTIFVTERDLSGTTWTLHPSKHFGSYQRLDVTGRILWIIYMIVHFLFFGFSLYWVTVLEADFRWGAWMVAATMIVVAACLFAGHTHEAYLKGLKDKNSLTLQLLCLGALTLGAIAFEILIVRWILHRQIFTFLPEGLTLTAICCMVVFFATDLLLGFSDPKSQPTN